MRFPVPQPVSQAARKAVDLVPESVLLTPPMRSLARRKLCSPIPTDRTAARPFILLSNARSGTNMFLSALNRHDAVAAHYELFNPTRPYSGRHGPGSSRWITAIRDRYPIEYYEEFIHRPYEQPVEVVCFKLFPNHRRDPRFAEAIEHLLQDPSLRFFHLRRPNKLAVLLSLRRAQRSGAWTSKSPVDHQPTGPLVHLQPSDCDAQFARLNEADDEIGACAGDRPVLSLTYGELTKSFDDSIARVQDFLEIDRAPTEPIFTRQRQGTLRDNIENFDELAERFAGTDYELYFDPDWPEQ